MAVSKNAREGKKQEQRKRICSAGHEQTLVKVARLVGRAVMQALCPCYGYEPIVSMQGYKSQQARQKAPGGKSRVWFESL